MISFLKARVLDGVDLLDRANDPFPAFDRPALPKYPETLCTKAMKFEVDLLDNFRIREGTILQYRIPLPIGSPLDLGDQSLWHGVMTFGLCVRNNIEPDP